VQFYCRIVTFIAFTACLTRLFAADTEPRLDAIVDWKADKIYLRAEWSLGRKNAERAAGELRAELRSALLTKLSSVVQTLWRRGSSTGESGGGISVPDLSDYWSQMKLSTFQIAENRASATMEIMLRGSDSLLAHLPAETGKEDWRRDDAAADVAYERRSALNEYDASQMEPILYTGLIIDARHLDFVPSLNTGVFTSSGRQLYGAVFLTRATLVKRGATGFFTTEGQSEARQRIGNRPLKVAALDLAHAGENTLVISDEDAAKLLAHDGSVKNLKRARVIVLVSPDKLREKY
jgi:hypothetical protein